MNTAIRGRKSIATTLAFTSISLMLFGGAASASVTVGSSIDLDPDFNRYTEAYQVQFSPASPSSKAYAVQYNLDSVEILNPTTRAISGSISVGDGPAAIAFTPDGTQAFVANYPGNSTNIIDSSTNTVVATVPVPGGPYDVTISPDGNFAVFPCYDDSSIKVMSVETHAIVKTIRIKHSGVWGARFTPNGKTLFAVGNNSGDVVMIDMTKKKVIKKISMRGYPWWLEVSPDGKEVMVTDYIDGESTIAVISVKKKKKIANIPIGTSIYSVAYAPDGDHAYVLNPDTRVVSVIDVATRAIVDTFTTTGTDPLVITFNPAGTLGMIGDRYGLITTFTPY